MNNNEITNYNDSIWFEGHLSMENAELQKYNRLRAYNWCDNRLMRCVEAYCLTEEDVLAIRKVYDTIPKPKLQSNPFLMAKDELAAALEQVKHDVQEAQHDAQSLTSSYTKASASTEGSIFLSALDQVEVDTVFLKFLDLPKSRFHYLIVNAISPKSEDRSSIIFSEYLNILCVICMLGTEDVKKFVFACADTSGDGEIG